MSKHGENIRLRTDGRWEARVMTGEPVNGKSTYKSLYGRSYQEVKQKKQNYLSGRLFRSEENGLSGSRGGKKTEGSFSEPVLSEVTFQEAAASWLSSRTPAWKESTLAHYTRIVRQYLLPELGPLALLEITSAMMEAFLRRMREQGGRDGGPLSAKTVSDLRCVLVQILSYANTKGWLIQVPNCPSVTSRLPVVTVLSRQEQQRLIQAILREGTVFGLGVLLSLYAGLRIGEVCGLMWKDVDRVNATLKISRTVMRIADLGGSGARTKIVVSAPKTETSNRTVPLPGLVFQYLMQFRLADDLYILTGRDKCMEPRVCRDRFSRLLGRSGIRHYSFHTLRHTYATRCIESGMDVKSLSEMMGHADVKITMQRYVHPSMDIKKEQVERLPIFVLDGQDCGQPCGEKTLQMPEIQQFLQN